MGREGGPTTAALSLSSLSLASSFKSDTKALAFSLTKVN